MWGGWSAHPLARSLARLGLKGGEACYGRQMEVSEFALTLSGEQATDGQLDWMDGCSSSLRTSSLSLSTVFALDTASLHVPPLPSLEGIDCNPLTPSPSLAAAVWRCHEMLMHPPRRHAADSSTVQARGVQPGRPLDGVNGLHARRTGGRAEKVDAKRTRGDVLKLAVCNEQDEEQKACMVLEHLMLSVSISCRGPLRL